MKQLFFYVIICLTAYSCKKNEDVVACFSADKTIAKIGDTLTFNIACSENVSNTKWIFGDGSEEEQDRKLTIRHSFREAGQYTITLRACDHAMWYRSTQCEETTRIVTIIP